jgi:ubiquinol-cytochrome c reductase iron-sulfur subunit
MERPRRRDWLVTTAYTAAGVGATLALWPFVAAMLPDDDDKARRIFFDIKPLVGTRRVTIGVLNRPVMIYRRTPEQLAALRNPKMENKTRDPYSPMGYAFRDRDSEERHQPDWAKNWHRSLRPEIMVCVAACTSDGVIVSNFDGMADDWICPACGSRYDLAGRAYSGPAPSNLRVPMHRYVSEHEIEFREQDFRV